MGALDEPREEVVALAPPPGVAFVLLQAGEGLLSERGDHLSATAPQACPSCVEALGAYRPDRFPTIEEYRRLEAEWPTPEYASGDEADAAFLAGWDRRKANRKA